MKGIDHYFIFLLSGIILNITPGADTLYILSRSISQGRRAGILSAAGISTGSIIHTCLAAFGLSLILAESALAFNIIKYTGAVYLVYLGIKTITQKDEEGIGSFHADSNSNSLKIYRQGLITNLFNPKVALFFISFLPQFINQNADRSPVPFIVLGATFITTGTIWCLVLVYSSSFISEKMRQNTDISSILQKVCGAVFIGLGVKLVAEK